VSPGLAAEPPRDLARRVAQRETETEAARAQYAYRQSLTVEEGDARGSRGGRYVEVRDVIFLPDQQRSDKVVKGPYNSLKMLILTPEDFADLRDVQPALFTLEKQRFYQTRLRGEETVDTISCWVLDLSPRQILEGQRFFEGTLWVDQRDYSIIRMEGKATPPIVRRVKGAREENLFPRFTTIRGRAPDGFWYPVLTRADDDLPFKSGIIRMKLEVRYENYQRFGSESQITFGINHN
jgi:hypothetical protein